MLRAYLIYCLISFMVSMSVVLFLDELVFFDIYEIIVVPGLIVPERPTT